MDLATTTDAGHPLLADFVALNDPDRRREIERRGDHFVVEGVLALERLLGLDGWEVRAIALSPRAAERLGPLVEPWRDRVVVADGNVLRSVVGFDLHRGVLASVARRPIVAADDLVVPGEHRIHVALEGVNDHENLGAIYRNAAAFGCASVLLDPTCADPFYRRSIRVSLGHVLAVPTGALAPVPTGIEQLRDRGATVLALVARGGRPLRSSIPPAPGAPVVVLAGAEGPGLSDAARGAADAEVTIEMAEGVDSLNVATALAVALHHLATG